MSINEIEFTDVIGRPCVIKKTENGTFTIGINPNTLVSGKYAVPDEGLKTPGDDIEINNHQAELVISGLRNLVDG